MSAPSPWLTVPQAADRAQSSVKVIYNAIARGKLKAVRLGARREWRVHLEWVDAWLNAEATIVNPEAPGPAVAFRRR